MTAGIVYRTMADWQAVYRIDPARARDDFHRVIQHDFHINWPRKIFTPGNASPFDFLATAFFHQDQDVAAWANRGGLKTLGAAVLITSEYAYYEQAFDARILAGSADQGRNLFMYWVAFAPRVLRHRKLSLLKEVSRIDKGRFEILTASDRSVRGPHLPKLFEDELDVIDPDLDETARGMVDGRDGVPGRTVYTSTWHKTDGAMSKKVAGSPGNGVQIFRWNIWETIAQCPPKRHKDGKGCNSCAFASACVEKAREFHKEPHRTLGIAAECEGLKKVPDVIKAYRGMSKKTWDAEWLCLRPSIEGCVYPEFDSMLHKKMTPPGGLKIYQAIDWGYRAFACLWLGVTKNGVIYVLDTYRAEDGTLKEHANYIKAHRLFGDVIATYCDPAGTQRNDQTGQSNIKSFLDWGIRCTFTRNAKLSCVRNGIQMVREALQPADTPHLPRLYYIESKNNAAFVHSMEAYHNRRLNNRWLDEPQPNQEFSHIPDCLRYAFINMGRSGGITRVPLGCN